MPPRYLIVNADDFGRSPGINRGIARAHEHGILTSASLMTRYPAATDAADYARRHPALSVGLHVDLGEYVYHSALYDWKLLYQVVPHDDPDSIAREVELQLESFRELTGADPTHLDSHQHVHRNQPARGILADLAVRLGVPLRQFSTEIHYCGAFHGDSYDGHDSLEDISVEHLLKILESLPEGATELACHPGYVDHHLEGNYHHERELEIETLCDPRVRAALERLSIRLTSFHSPHRSSPEAPTPGSERSCTQRSASARDDPDPGRPTICVPCAGLPDPGRRSASTLRSEPGVKTPYTPSPRSPSRQEE